MQQILDEFDDELKRQRCPLNRGKKLPHTMRLPMEDLEDALAIITGKTPCYHKLLILISNLLHGLFSAG